MPTHACIRRSFPPTLLIILTSLKCLLYFRNAAVCRVLRSTRCKAQQAVRRNACQSSSCALSRPGFRRTDDAHGKMGTGRTRAAFMSIALWNWHERGCEHVRRCHVRSKAMFKACLRRKASNPQTTDAHASEFSWHTLHAGPDCEDGDAAARDSERVLDDAAFVTRPGCCLFLYSAGLR